MVNFCYQVCFKGFNEVKLEVLGPSRISEFVQGKKVSVPPLLKKKLSFPFPLAKKLTFCPAIFDFRFKKFPSVKRKSSKIYAKLQGYALQT